ncbi:metal-dependent hydrolase [Gorillibacterium timonense]|uniref:metal-dependent hydrolase n=1 Tax=Gorillibacterium timonense TaxID=1689269 RepID=UPI00071E07C8|nr:metal-dependent hydrolase [Gorillibacterium timonense]
MEIRFHGHSCIQLTGGGHSVIIDPFLTGNSLATVQAQDIEVDCVLLTHGHGDHIGDAEEIALRCGAQVIAIAELAGYIGKSGAKAVGMNLGGTYRTEFARFKMVQAFHSSSVEGPDGQPIYMGMPAGFLIEMEDRTILHCGDTALFGDMKLIGERHNIDVAFIPIGDHYTMGPEDAALAAEWLKAKVVVPIHYNTFPPIRQNPLDYLALLEERDIHGRILEPGEVLVL